jgi:hypothetical protein
MSQNVIGGTVFVEHLSDIVPTRGLRSRLQCRAESYELPTVDFFCLQLIVDRRT